MDFFFEENEKEDIKINTDNISNPLLKNFLLLHLIKNINN